MKKSILIKIKSSLYKTEFGKKVVKLYHYVYAVPISKLLLVRFYIIRHLPVYKMLESVNFYSDYEVFDSLITDKKSLCRFGDGEISWIYQDSNGYFGQENSVELSERLKEIIMTQNDAILIGIPKFFDDMKGYSKSRINSRNIHLAKTYKRWNLVVNYDWKYADALITRVYNGRNNVNHEEMFSLWKKVWENRRIVLIEGEGTRFGVGNDLLRNALSIERVIAPAENAFSKYYHILSVAKRFEKDVLFLIALGPTATVLAYDLALLGYQAVDIGHLDIEYEWYNRHVKRPTPIEGKYVNEAGGMSNANINLEVMQEYLNEIKYTCTEG